MSRHTAQRRKRRRCEGNEKADDLAKAGAMLDEGFIAAARAETLQQDREEVLIWCRKWSGYAKPFPVQTCAVFFLLTSVSGFVLSKFLQPSFVVSHLFSWQVLMMGPMRLSLLCLVPLRIRVLLMVLA